MSVVPERRWIFGCGYLGARVAHRWLDQGHQVQVVTRSAAKAQQLAQDGLAPIVADLKLADSLPKSIDADRLLFSVGFDRQGPETIDDVYVSGLRNVLDRLASPPSSLVYISSTGVYGSGEGEWIDENSPCAPERAGGQACLACEQLLAQHPQGQHAIVLRLAGIYGPGRIPNGASLREGLPVRGYSTGYLNLIHVDDAASVVDLVLGLPGPETFVVSDGSPVLRQDYYRYLAHLYGVAEPAFVDPEPGSAKARRGAGSKRVSNTKLVAQLGFRPKYASYKTGLEAIVQAADNDPPGPMSSAT